MPNRDITSRAHDATKPTTDLDSYDWLMIAQQHVRDALDYNWGERLKSIDAAIMALHSAADKWREHIARNLR